MLHQLQSNNNNMGNYFSVKILPGSQLAQLAKTYKINQNDTGMND